MNSRFFILSACLWTIVPLSFAAVAPATRPELQLFSFETRVLPELEIYEPGAPFEHDARVTVRYYAARVLLPWRFQTEKSRLSCTFGYQSVAIDYKGWDESVDPTTADNLHAIQFSFFYHRELKSPVWSFTAFVTPGYNSDFKGVSSEALRIQGGTFWNRGVGKGNLSLGIALLNDYGRPRVFPGIAYTGSIGEKQTVVIRLPTLISWAYSFSETLDGGLAARVVGNNFHIEEEGRYHDHAVRYSVGTAGPFVRWSLTKKLSLLVESGTTMRHSLAYTKDRSKVREMRFKPAVFGSFGIQYKI